jgi:hypothetical protein
MCCLGAPCHDVCRRPECRRCVCLLGGE